MSLVLFIVSSDKILFNMCAGIIKDADVRHFENLSLYCDELRIFREKNLFSIIEIHPKICSYEKAKECAQRKKGFLFFGIGNTLINNALIADLLMRGADDYVNMNINPIVLFAKIKSYQRRNEMVNLAKKEGITSRNKHLQIIPERRTVVIKEKTRKKIVKLTQKEYEILSILLANENEIIDRERMLKCVWKEKAEKINPQILDKYIELLRKKLNSAGKNIETIYGAGYKYASE